MDELEERKEGKRAYTTVKDWDKGHRIVKAGARLEVTAEKEKELLELGVIEKSGKAKKPLTIAEIKKGLTIKTATNKVKTEKSIIKTEK